MKQIVKDCFGEMGTVQTEKPVPGSGRMKFDANLFDYAGSLSSLNILLEESVGDQLCSPGSSCGWPRTGRSVSKSSRIT